jgi:hypothetical protein
LLAPCAYRLGEPTKRQCRGRVLSLDLCEAAVSKLTLLFAEPGSRVPASGFSAHRYRDPTRLPRTRSAAGGPAAEARFYDQRIRRTFQSRAHRDLAAIASHAPLREENDDRPRPGLTPSCRLAMCSSWGLAAFLGRTAGVLRIRFYNRRLLTSTRRENTLFGDCPPNAVGRPAVVPLRDPPRERRF